MEFSLIKSRSSSPTSSRSTSEQIVQTPKTLEGRSDVTLKITGTNSKIDLNIRARISALENAFNKIDANFDKIHWGWENSGKLKENWKKFIQLKPRLENVEEAKDQDIQHLSLLENWLTELKLDPSILQDMNEATNVENTLSFPQEPQWRTLYNKLFNEATGPNKRQPHIREEIVLALEDGLNGVKEQLENLKEKIPSELYPLMSIFVDQLTSQISNLKNGTLSPTSVEGSRRITTLHTALVDFETVFKSLQNPHPEKTPLCLHQFASRAIGNISNLAFREQFAARIDALFSRSPEVPQFIPVFLPTEKK